MPGRPKMMAKKVTELEKRAMVLEADVAELIPGQYMKRDNCGPDPLGLGQAWKNAADAALNAYCALAELGDILRNKAGISVEDREADEVDAPAPSDLERGNPETTETPQEAERKHDDSPDSVDNP